MALGIKEVSFKTVTASAMTLWIGFYTWRIMFNNFAVEEFGASPTAIGIIQATREIPGLLAFGVGALALYMTETRIASLSVVVLGLGLILSGAAPSIVMLGMATFFMSLGFHYFYPANDSQLLIIAGKAQSGKIQGRYNSFESIAGLTGGFLVLILTLFLSYRSTLYLIGGVVTVVGIYFALALPPNRGKSEQRKIRLKKKYWLYYALSFLRGCRRHIFTTFAIFLLVHNHGLSIALVSTVMLANNVVTFFTNRMIGNMSDRYGERVILAGASFFLIFIFLGYAFVEYLPLLIAFYLIDNILYGSSIALRSYLSKVADDEDLTSCLSFGTTSNHITAVIIPVVGGIIWTALGHAAPFIVGAVIVALDCGFSFLVPKGGDRIESSIS